MDNGGSNGAGAVSTGGMIRKSGIMYDSAAEKKTESKPGSRFDVTAASQPPPDDDESPAKKRKFVHPDPDAIKMFIGQIPRRIEEAEVRKVFEEFGDIYELSILKERASGESRGCGFITYFSRQSALKAQEALHNKRTFPGMHNPMQLKPADVEPRSERKLFVGMIGKQTEDEQVLAMFQQFGPVEECTVLRDAQKNSKGCAFVTFMSRQNSLTAIRQLHHSKIMEGCSAPLVVKFAEQQRPRVPFAGPAGGANRQPLGGFNSAGNNSGGWGGRQQQQQQQQPNLMNQMNQMNQMSQLGQSNPQAMALLQQLSNAANALSALAGQGGGMFGGPPPGQQQQQNNPAGALAMMLQAAGMNRPQGNQQFQAAPANNAPNFNNTTTSGGGSGSGAPAAAADGAEGGSLFVYHLPAECGDSDLASMFSPFGNIVTASVVVDKETGQSRGFGSVSFDSGVSAQAAVQGMDGFQIGDKQLKVLLKRSFGQSN